MTTIAMPESGISAMLKRYVPALAFAIVVTLFLLVGMKTLITGGNDVLTEPPRGNVLDFIRLKRDETVQKKARKPQKPPKPATPPPQMQPPQMQQSNPNSDAVSTSFNADIAVDAGLAGGLSLESGDGDYLPIVKVAPVYPRRAQSRGIEGYVIVEFTVSKNGSVKDAVVIEASPESIFDRAALDAALKFKYKPRVVDGEPMEVAGVQNKISFEIDG
ncbi:energy transducer TonB [Thalassotalea atypica]|uniref:energy transducer TonB n=1 Tax=Thalassotalea atypica TaxID=2054316 RepID=UPI002572F3AD|nr:energy transducer TonB [Thalassotalea atypica]